MKQRISALMLAVTPTFRWVAALLAAATALEYCLFRRAMHIANTGFTEGEVIPAFEQIMESVRPDLVLGGVFLLFCALFLLTGCEQKGGKLAYTLRRLSVDEREIHISWAIYYTLCFVLLALWQVGVYFLLYHLYAASPFGEGLSPSAWFLTAYRNDLLHSLFPLHDIPRHLRNALIYPCLGLSCSAFSLHLRRGRRSWAPLFLIALTALTFVRNPGNSAMDIFTLVYTAWLTAIALRHTWRDPDAE